jgi:asparaginyl-tRNA synthetase
LENRHLIIGISPKMCALTKIKAILMKSAREFFDKDNWLEVSPTSAISTLSGACEDFSTIFSLDFYGKKAFLIQTGQQHMEAFIRGPINKVYSFNMSYRAETIAPERRLSSFLLIEAEAAQYDLNKIQEVQERLIYKLCEDILIWGQPELSLLGANTTKLMSLTIPLIRITYSEAITKLNQRGFQINWGEDLKSNHEKALGEFIGAPFFVTHYPGIIKFFNMKDDPANPQQVLSSDLLVPGFGEIIGASEREDDYYNLETKLERFCQEEKRIIDMKNLGITNKYDLKSIYKWYLDLRKEKCTPHAGFGLGFERLVQWICDFQYIFECTEYPINKNHLAP